MRYDRKNYKSKIFTFLIVTYPIIFIYATPIPSISFADFLLILLYPILLLKYVKDKINITKGIYFTFIPYLSYILVQVLVVGLNKTTYEWITILLPTLRYSFYIFTIVLFFKNLFDLDFGIKILIRTSIVASIIIIIQFAVYKLIGVYIKAYIPNLPLMRQELLTFGDSIIGDSIRPRSLFAEPAHYSQYVLLGLGLILSKSKLEFKSYISIAIIGLGILISGSGTGIIVCIIMFTIFIIQKIRKLEFKRKFKFICILLILIPSIFIIATKIDNVHVFINRTFIADTNNSAEGRLLGYISIFNQNNTVYEVIFGNGIITLNDYFPTITLIYIYFGIIGIFIVITMFIKIIKNGKGYNRISAWIFITLFIGTELFLGPFILLYTPFMILQKESSKFSSKEI